MNAKSSRAKIVVVSAVGAALVLPLFLNPASAVTDGSHFYVHAQDQNNPKPHEALAGLGGLKVGAGGSTGSDGGSTGGSSGNTGGSGSGGSGSGTGGGGSDGSGTGGSGSDGSGTGGSNSGSSDGIHGSSGPGSSSDTSAVIGVYSSGPVSVRITQAMLDFSAANVRAQQEGRTGDIRTAPNGWQTVWFQHAGSEDFTQDPIGLSDTGMVFLSKVVSPPNSWEATSENTDFVAYYNRYSSSSVEAYDSLVGHSAGSDFYYRKSSGGSGGGTEISEGRYISEEGRVIAATVTTNPYGYDVKRRTSATDRSAPASDSKPYNVTASGDKVSQIELRLKSTIDGYNQILISDSMVRYAVWSGVDAYGNQDTNTMALRKSGPSLVYFNGDGSYSFIMYADADGNMQSLDGSDGKLTVASYNEATGQSWDGKLPKLSSFDGSKPFTPQG